MADSILYIDTNIIMDILFEKRRQARKDNELMINKIKKSQYQIKIPQIVIGEIVIQIIRRTSNSSEKDDQNGKLSNF